MALTSVLNSTTQDVIRPKLVDNIFNNYPVLNILRTRLNTSQNGGTSIVLPIIYAKKTAVSTYSGYGTVTNTPNDSITSVAYSWGHYHASMNISRTDQLKNSGASQMVNLLTAEAQIAEKTLADTLTTDLFAASAVTNGLAGFPVMAATTTTCGGISSTDTAAWAASVDSSSGVLTLGLMISKWSDVAFGSDVTTHIITNPYCFQKIWQLYEPKQDFRLQNKNGNLVFMGAEIVQDRAVVGTGGGTADSAVYFINDKYIEFFVHPDDNFKIHPWQKPTNQFVQTAEITFSGQIATSNRRTIGALTAINPTA